MEVVSPTEYKQSDDDTQDTQDTQDTFLRLHQRPSHLSLKMRYNSGTGWTAKHGKRTARTAELHL